MKILNLKLGLGIVSDDNEFVDEKKRVTRRHDRNHQKNLLGFQVLPSVKQAAGCFLCLSSSFSPKQSHGLIQILHQATYISTGRFCSNFMYG